MQIGPNKNCSPWAPLGSQVKATRASGSSLSPWVTCSASSSVATAQAEGASAHAAGPCGCRSGRAAWVGLALIDDRDDCFAIGEVNQQAPFPRVAAVVHHGAAGTTTTAARAGAPQVVVRQMADQPYWAGRVAALGIGTAHDCPAPTTESLSSALSTALIRQIRARATAVAGTIRTDGATVAARLLLDAVSRARRPVSA